MNRKDSYIVRAGFPENYLKNAFFLLPAIDGAEDNSTWGRLSMDVSAEPSVVYIVHIIALNEQLIAGNDGDISVDKYLSDFDVDQEKKNLFFKNAGEVRSDRKSTRLNSSHPLSSRMPSSA